MTLLSIEKQRKDLLLHIALADLSLADRPSLQSYYGGSGLKRNSLDAEAFYKSYVETFKAIFECIKAQ